MRGLKFLEAVIYESLRCFPPSVSGVGRQTTEAININGTLVPKDVTVGMDIWAVHYSKQAWGQDAAEWRPERWLQGRTVHSAKKDVEGNLRWLPFAQGPQSCLGQHLALVRTFGMHSEGNVILA
jgi:cytochrome P450